MADVTLDPQNSNPKELYGQGVRAYVLQDYDTAVSAFSTASELLAKEHEDDLHDSLGEIYLYYGKSLLELSRKEGGALGEGVLKNVDEESESEENNEEDAEDAQKQTDGDEPKANGEAKDETKPSEEGDKGDEKEAEPGTSSENKEVSAEETEDDLSDLQVAWEVLELAKKIFVKRGDDGRKNLAETMIVLGEISLESGNFPSAIDDMKEGLEIQKKLFGNDSRAVAETYYKLGGALSTNGQIDEAIESFSSSYEYLNNRVTSLKKDGLNADEIKELDELMPEIQEKIADMKNLKSEVAQKVTSAVDDGAPAVNGASSSSSKPASDISHLVKRKRKAEDVADGKEEESLNPAKKPTP